MSRLLASCVLSALPLPATSDAAEFVYTTTLSGAAESPANASPGVGTSTVTYDSTAHTLRVQAEFSGLEWAVTAAHIHGPTALPLEGTAGVITTTPSFAGFPAGVTSGSYDQTLDLTLASSFNPSFVTAQGGSLAAAEAALATALAEGKAYFNIHTAGYPAGEIRGFFNVPEPAGMAVITIGALALARGRRPPAQVK